jgi:hypothetical protein
MAFGVDARGEQRLNEWSISVPGGEAHRRYAVPVGGVDLPHRRH